MSRCRLLRRIASCCAWAGMAMAPVAASEAPVVTVSVGSRTAQGEPGQTIRVRGIPLRMAGLPIMTTAHVEGAPFHGVGIDWLVLRSATTTTAPSLLWAPSVHVNAPSGMRVLVDQPVLAPGQSTSMRVYLTVPETGVVEASTFASGTVYYNSSPGVVAVQPDGRVVARSIQGLEAFALVTAYHRGVIGIAQITVRASGDRDGDGLPDRWEIEHGLDPDNPADAHVDSDGDTLIARDEWRLGTDPRNDDTDRDGLNDAQDPEPLVPERQAPQVHFITPDDATQVEPGEVLAVEVAASDNGRVRMVRIMVGSEEVAALGQRPFVVAVAVPDDGRERLTLRAEAEDVAGNRGMARIDLDVRMGPPGYPVADRVVAGPTASVVRKSDGTWWSWGGNASDQLGIGAGPSPTMPMEVLADLGTARQIAVGGQFAVACLADGTVHAWGAGTSGQLGVESPPPRRVTPMPVAGPVGATAVAAGEQHALALDGSGTVWAWGANAAGQAGTGDRTGVPTAVRVPLPGIVMIAAGADFSVGLDRDGVVWAWGSNIFGQAAPGQLTPDLLVPQPVEGLPRIAAIAAGAGHALALDESGMVWAWGDGRRGQVPGGGQRRIAGPQRIALDGATSIAAGGSTSAAVDAGGRLWVWGADPVSGLRDLTEPAIIDDVPGVASVALGAEHALLLTRSGDVWCLGANQQRQADPRSGSGRIAPARAPMYPHTVRMDSADVVVFEEGPDLTLPIRRSGDIAAPLEISLVRGSGTLSIPGDLAGIPERMSFPAGEAVGVCVLQPQQDVAIEGDEHVVLHLEAHAIANIGRPASARITLVDDDRAAPLPRVVWQSIPGRLAEGQSGRLIAVRSGAPLTAALAVPLVWDGATTDVEAVPSQLVFQPGEAVSFVDLMVVADAEVERDETLTVAMQPGPTAVVDAAQRSIILTDATPGPSYVLQVLTPSCTESDDHAPAMLRLLRTGDASSPGFVQLEIGGSASMARDFAMLKHDVVIPAGEASILIPVIPIDDGLVEGDETVTVSIAGVDDRGRIGEPSTAAVVIQDDEPPGVSFASFPARMREDEALDLVLVRVGDLRQGFSVPIMASETAAAGRISPLPEMATFAPGQREARVTVAGIHIPGRNDLVSLTIAMQPGPGYSLVAPHAISTQVADVEAEMSIGFESDVHFNVPEGTKRTVSIKARTTHGILPETIDIACVLGIESAEPGEDFSTPPTRLRLSVAPRSSFASAAITIAAHHDDVTEPNESFTLTVDDLPSGFMANGPTARIVIAESWTGGTTGLALVEGSSASIRLGRSATVALSTRLFASIEAGGTAILDEDYAVELPTEIILGPNAGALVDIPVQALADAQGEMPETFGIRLRQERDPVDGGRLVPVTIYDPLRIARVYPAATAGQEGRTAQFTVTLEGSSGTRTIAYRLSGAAANTADITWIPAMTGSISTGAAASVINVPIRTDALVEGTEDLVVELLPGTGYLIDPTAGSATMPIVDLQDTGLPLVNVSVPDGLAVERSDDHGLLRISRDGSPEQPLAVQLLPTGSGSQPLPSTVTIPAGSLFVDVPVVAVDDALKNPSKQVSVAIAPSPIYRVGVVASGSVTIGDDASQFTIHADRTSMNEGDHGLSLTVRRTQFLDRPAGVNLITSLSGASVALDGLQPYVALAAGVDSATMQITARQDDVGQDLRRVTVSLQPVGESVAGAPSSVTIDVSDDGDPASVEFVGSPYSVREGASVTITLRRRGVLDQPAQVQWALSPRTPAWGAASMADCAQTEGVASFAAGQSTTTFQFAAADDDESEPDELIDILLRPGQGTIPMPGMPTAWLTIGDTDPPVGRFATGSYAILTEPASGIAGTNVWCYRVAGDRSVPCDVRIAFGGGGAEDARFFTMPARNDDGVATVRIPVGSSSAPLECRLAASPATFEDLIQLTAIIQDPGTLSRPGYAIDRSWYLRDSLAPPCVVAMDVDSASVREDGGTQYLGATLSRPLDVDVFVNWHIAWGAVPMQGNSGEVRVPAGSTRIDIPVTPLDDEDVRRPDGQFMVRLGSGICLVDPDRYQTLVTVVDDDARDPVRVSLEVAQGVVRDGDRVLVVVRPLHPVDEETVITLALAPGLRPADGQVQAQAVISSGSIYGFCEIEVDDDGSIGLPRRLLDIGVDAGGVEYGGRLRLLVEDRHPASIEPGWSEVAVVDGHASVRRWSGEGHTLEEPLYPMEQLYDGDASSSISGPLLAVHEGQRPVAISQQGYVYEWINGEFQPVIESMMQEFVDPETGESWNEWWNTSVQVHDPVRLQACNDLVAIQRRSGEIVAYSRAWDGYWTRLTAEEVYAETLEWNASREGLVAIARDTVRVLDGMYDWRLDVPWNSTNAPRVIDIGHDYVLASDGRLYPLSGSRISGEPAADRMVDIAGNIALDADGRVWAWNSSYGAAVPGADGIAVVGGIDDVVRIAKRDGAAFAMTRAGEVYTWGRGVPVAGPLAEVLTPVLIGTRLGQESAGGIGIQAILTDIVRGDPPAPVWELRRSGDVSGPATVGLQLTGALAGVEVRAGASGAPLLTVDASGAGWIEFAEAQASVMLFVNATADAELGTLALWAGPSPDGSFADSLVVVRDPPIFVPELQLTVVRRFAQESGVQDAMIRIARNGDLTQAYAPAWRLSGGGNGADFIMQPSQIAFAPGVAEIDVVVRAVQDDLPEGDEVVWLMLPGAAEWIVIADDDVGLRQVVGTVRNAAAADEARGVWRFGSVLERVPGEASILAVTSTHRFMVADDGLVTSAGAAAGSWFPSPLAGAAIVNRMVGGGDQVGLRSLSGEWSVFGSNQFGQLGIGQTATPVAPVGSPVANTVAIVPGLNFTLWLDASGGLWYAGRVGNTLSSVVPQPLSLPASVRSVYAGSFPAMIDADGTAWRWTDEAATVGRWETVKEGVADLAVGRRHMVMRDTSGRLWAAGEGDAAAGSTSLSTPVPIDGFDGVVVGLAAGDDVSYLLTVDGNVWTWGRQVLGVGRLLTTSEPAPIRLNPLRIPVELMLDQHRLVEGERNVSTLTVTRADGLIGSLDVLLLVDGTASLVGDVAVDGAALVSGGLRVIIPGGQDSVRVRFQALTDTVTEGEESLRIHVKETDNIVAGAGAEMLIDDTSVPGGIGHAGAVPR